MVASSSVHQLTDRPQQTIVCATAREFIRHRFERNEAGQPPIDLKALRAVQRGDYAFVTSYRDWLRKTPVLMRVRAEENGFIVDVYKAQFSLDKPSAPDGDMALLFQAACLLPLDTECSLTFKSLCFSDSDITQLKECVFPADCVARFFLQSEIASRSFRIEDDQSFTKENEGTSNDVGDALLSVFLSSDCDAISLSTVEEVSYRGLVNFIREWRRSPREFSRATFVRSERFDNESHVDMVPSTIYPFCKSDLVLRAQLESVSFPNFH
ncbi:unnamed protein product [Nippostrongylus brasiliensis]|uniref:BACK domain-containing protein n=1 Tax=Nippostrongylus brasiliensis TaxID=27835 RepID=A0A0N4YM08_NIPBR|nr:unnamed protein product [Nippostrongylus brasiliensis]